MNKALSVDRNLYSLQTYGPNNQINKYDIVRLVTFQGCEYTVESTNHNIAVNLMVILKSNDIIQLRLTTITVLLHLISDI